jgi:hypothetical protein
MTQDELVAWLRRNAGELDAEGPIFVARPEALADALEAALENIPALHVMSGGDVEQRREAVKRKARAAFRQELGRDG